MADTWIVKLPRHDVNYDQAVLLHVTQKKSHGLDLDILATEGEAVYKGKVRNKKLKDIRSNQDISDADFATIIHHALVSKLSSKISIAQEKSLEVVASIVAKKKSEKTLNITFRNRIDGITQRLGEIELRESDDEISFFDWAAAAVDKQNAAESELASLRNETESDRTTIASLQAQLADLKQAKTVHEDQLVMKFSLLLNEKKLKIRDQQRALSTAKGDAKKLKGLQDTIRGERTSTSSRRGKRAAEDVAQEAESDSGDAFEDAASMGISRETTPEAGTASEDEETVDALALLPVPSRSAKAASQLSQPKQAASSKQKPKDADQSEAQTPVPSLDSDEETASEDETDEL